MKSDASLRELCADFAKKTAGISEDMAKRVMYSIIPHLAEPAHIALTNGVVDYNALKTAVQGVKSLIKYCAEAVLHELQHCKDNSYFARAEAQFENEDKEAMADLAVSAFSQPKLWFSSFGGFKWEQIARTLRQLIRLDKALDQAKSSRKDPEQMVQIMKDMVVQMNILDGLAHNSADVMRNILQYEQEDLANQGLKPEYYGDKYHRLRRIMDAKELENPIEVYKYVEPTLKDSGDINQFKDWQKKIHRTEDYRKTDEKTLKKLLLIFLRKNIIHGRNRIDQTKEERVVHYLNKLISGWTTGSYVFLHNNIQILVNEIYFVEEEIADAKSSFLRQYPEFASRENEIDNIIEPYNLACIKIYDKIEMVQKRMPEIDKDDETGKIIDFVKPLQDVAIKQTKELISLTNQFIYLLDMI